jgi:AcrR family transcriptional regulator
MAVTTPAAGSPAPTGRPLESDKAKRIVDAMRESVAARGAAGSTFDHVAREAGVSRGLLHYYFGTKEQLLAEVVRRDSDLRMTALEESLAGARSAEDFVALLRSSLEGMLAEDPEFVTLVFELFTLSRRNDEIAVAFAELLRRARDHVAALLDAKQREGVVHLHAGAEAVADVLFAMADGLAIRMLAEPEREWEPAVEAAVLAVRALLA